MANCGCALYFVFVSSPSGWIDSFSTQVLLPAEQVACENTGPTCRFMPDVFECRALAADAWGVCRDADVLQIVISVMFFTRWQVKSDTLSILAAIQVLFLWWKVQYFAR